MRPIIPIFVGLIALLFWYIGLTVPMSQATAPIILALVLTGTAIYLWRIIKTHS